MPSLAEVAEVLRSVQKDEWFLNRLNQNATVVSQQLLGLRKWLQFRNIQDVVVKAIYYGLTTVNGYQTIGEEYAGVVQVDSSLRRVPSTARRVLQASLVSCGPLIIRGILKTWKHSVRQSSRLDPNQKSRAEDLLSVLEYSLTIIERLHVSLFYLGSGFYQLSKRITGIHYLAVRPWINSSSRIRWIFRILGFVSLVSLSLDVFLAFWQWYSRKNSRSSPPKVSMSDLEEQDVEQSEKCPLCLNKRSFSSAAPCGHLFCWDCIVRHAQINQTCPVCRREFSPSRIIPLINYDSDRNVG